MDGNERETYRDIVIPANAKELSIVLTGDNDANLVLIDNTRGQLIVGDEAAIFKFEAGTNVYRGMEITYSGDDSGTNIRETITSPLTTITTWIQ